MAQAAICLIILLFASIAYLIYLANQANMVAIGVLFSLSGLVWFVLFKGADIIGDWLRDRAESKRMQANMKENVDIMNSMFRAQNTQAKAQASQMAFMALQQKQLGAGQPKSQVVVDPNLFSDFDQEEDYE